MNHLLGRHILAAVLVAIMVLALASCKEDPPVQQPPGTDTTKHEDTTKPAPTGMPDWNDPQHDWLLKRDSVCAWRDIAKDYWTPKFSFLVTDASPDGRRILLLFGDRTAIYDTTTRDIHTVFPFGCEFAEWSHDGRYIAGVSNYPAIQQRFVLYDVVADRWQFLPLPDSTEGVNPVLHWMPGDSSILVGVNFFKSAGYHTLQIVQPHRITKSTYTLGYRYANGQVYTIAGPSTGAELRVASLTDSLVWKSYSLSGLLWAGENVRISPDGNWMLFRMDADIAGSRFGSAGKVTSLGIIDLGPGSSTQYQLYRVFPDYTNTYRNCSAAWFFSGGAWSGDGKYVYHEQVRIADSTTQIVRRNVRTGKVEPVSNFLMPP
jgi:hypothetical protein